MSDTTLRHLQATLFSEALKSEGLADFSKDAMKIAGVMQNRYNNPERYGDGWSEIASQSQFSGVNSDEYYKAFNNELTDEERPFANKARQIAYMAMQGNIPEVKADHYYSKKVDRISDKEHWTNQYPIVDESEGHIFMSEKEWNAGKLQTKSYADDIPFESAFAKARKKGNKTFSWRGKRYSTAVK